MKIFRIVFILVISSLTYGITIDNAFKANTIPVKKYKYYQIEKLCQTISNEIGINIVILKSSNQRVKIMFTKEKISLYDFLGNLYKEGALIQLLYDSKINFIIYIPLNELNIEVKSTTNEERGFVSKDIIKSFEELVNVEKAGGYELGEIAKVLKEYHNIDIIINSFETEFCIRKGIAFLDFLERISKFEKNIKLLMHFKDNRIVFQIESLGVKLKDNFSVSRISLLEGCLGKNLIFADIKEQPITFIFSTLESIYNKNITLEEESIKDIVISYKKSNISIDDFIKDISFISGVSFYFEKDKIKVKGK